MKLFTLPRILVSLLLLLVTAAGVDRLLLAPSCPPCHSELTAELPMLDGSIAEGLVRIGANDFEFRARVAGLDNHDGDGVILLHGYPETSIMWQAAMTRLAKSGFRVVAFDQRGYSPGARPSSLSSYGVDTLAGDVIAVADAVGFDRFHLVGHDWGGMVGWIAAGRYPSRIATWTSLSTPHPGAYGEALSPLGGTNQLRRSSYILLNWIPWSHLQNSWANVWRATAQPCRLRSARIIETPPIMFGPRGRLLANHLPFFGALDSFDRRFT